MGEGTVLLMRKVAPLCSTPSHWLNTSCTHYQGWVWEAGLPLGFGGGGLRVEGVKAEVKRGDGGEQRHRTCITFCAHIPKDAAR
jgi:hypothetical protein